MARADIHKLTGNENTHLTALGYKFPKEPEVIEVVLSERNLISLLSKLYIEGSQRTIYQGDVPEGYVLKLVAEDDVTHYVNEERLGIAGAMHPETEALVGALKDVLREHDKKNNIVNLFKVAVETARGEAS